MNQDVSALMMVTVDRVYTYDKVVRVRASILESPNYREKYKAVWLVAFKVDQDMFVKLAAMKKNEQFMVRGTRELERYKGEEYDQMFVEKVTFIGRTRRSSKDKQDVKELVNSF